MFDLHINEPLASLTIEVDMSHIKRKIWFNILYGTTSNNYRRLHGGFVIRQRAYDKNNKNKKKK